jgi:hypothetical protein
MQRLRAITPPLLTLKTNSQPFVLRCEGFVSYLCKTALTPAPLICETFCACFLRDWSCPTPPFAFVEMEQELMPPKLAIDHEKCFYMRQIVNGILAENLPEPLHFIISPEPASNDTHFPLWSKMQDYAYIRLVTPERLDTIVRYAVDHNLQPELTFGR